MAMKSKLPTFQEWMEERDPVMSENLWKAALGTAALGAGILGGTYMMSRDSGSSAPPPRPRVQMVQNNDSSTNTNAMFGGGVSKSSVTPKDIPSKSAIVDDDDPTPPPAKIGKTFNMRGGHSGYADVKTTVSRPGKNVWVFDIKGEIKPRDAIEQAKAIVQDELGTRTRSGITAEFNPTDDGMSVTIRYATPGQRQGVIDAMR